MLDNFDPKDPALLKIHQKRLAARDIDQLLAVCEFSLQDGVIEQEEACAILDWLNSHRSSLDAWPASILYDRLHIMLKDGCLDDQEQGELLGLLMSISKPRNLQGNIAPTTLPLTAPTPLVCFEKMSFCFTGVFDFGTRDLCQKAVIQRGGIAAKDVTKKLNYLVIGNVGSECWKHSSFGGKIIKAMSLLEAGTTINIIDEDTWSSEVYRTPALVRDI